MPNPRKLLHLKTEQSEVEVERINIAGRNRTEYGNIPELALSIEQKGLINPVALMKYNEPLEGKWDYFLLAGGRRIEAFKKLERAKIPARIYPDGLNGYEIRAIELEENLRRKDLNDAERLKMTKQVHDLYVDLYGLKTSTARGALGQSQRDTAKQLGVSPTTISRDLELAAYLEKVPGLAKLGDASAIRRAIKKAKMQVKVEASLKDERTKAVKGSPKDRLIKSYVVGDFFKEVKSLPSGVIHFIDHDIDYPMDLDKYHITQKEDRENNVYQTVSKQEYPDLMKESLAECYRVMANDTWIVIWFGYEYFDLIQEWAKVVGFRTTYYHGKWYKGKGRGHTRNPEYSLNHVVEPFFYFKKGTPTIAFPHDDLFEYAPTLDSLKKHPFEKPQALMDDIFSLFGQKSGRVLIPFAGSGNSIISAWKSDCIVVGIDSSQGYKDAFEAFVRTNIKDEGE